jgi:hypothetical protein
MPVVVSAAFSPAATSAASSGLSMPVSKAAFRWASRSTCAEAAPATSTAASSDIRPSVSVPVLSVHSTSMLPRSSIASSRLTITPRLTIARAPRASVTLTIAGSSSGERPTASATANSSDSSAGRPSSWLTASTKNTMTTMMRKSR